MPRLVADAPEWEVIFPGQGLDHRLKLIVAVMETLPQEARKAMRLVAGNPEFASCYANAGLHSATSPQQSD